jgi:hypothetical protein
MLERQSDEQIADMLDLAEMAGAVPAGEVTVDAMDLVRILNEVIDYRADSRNTAAATTHLHDGLVEWAASEPAGKAAWRAWYEAMVHQRRDVSRHQMKWEILDPQDQLLHAQVAQLLISAAIDAVHDGEEAPHGGG